MNCKKMRKLMIVSLFVGSFVLLIEPVFALDCDGILTQEAADFLGKIIGYIQILVPVLLIILGGTDFASVVINEDKDNMKKASGKFVKRCICGALIFFVPLFVKTLLNVSGIAGTLVDDPMCGIENIESEEQQEQGENQEQEGADS